jgi:CNT family concentrative nucleoside transporter
MPETWYLNVLSFFGIFGLCAIAWLFSEHRRVIPWRVMISGILLQLLLGAAVFLFPPTKGFLQKFSNLLDGVFAAAEVGARFVFGPKIVPTVYGANPDLGYIFAFRALPTVVFFSGLMALLENLGIIQVVTNIFAKVFYTIMRLSGAEALSGAANIFVGIEAAIVVKPYLAKMTRSELCAILSCCFGTAASSTLAIYVSFLRPVFPNILGHLVSASIIAIPACFVLSKILVPETEVPLTAGGIPQEKKAPRKIEGDNKQELVDFQDNGQDIPKQETVGGEPMQRMSPLDAAIVGALDGVKMAVSIAAVLILILGLVNLINQLFGWLGGLPSPIGDVFKVVTLANIQGALFLPLTFLTGVSLDWNEIWQSSVIIGRRLLETAIPPYQALSVAALAPAAERVISDRAVLIVSYALSGFAHLASVGIFVGGTIALIPSRRKDITELGWKALFVGTLATMMIACVAGVFDTGDPGILGQTTPAPQSAPAASPTSSPTVSPSPAATTTPTPAASPSPTPSPSAANPTAPKVAETSQLLASVGQSKTTPPATVAERVTAQEQQENQALLDKARILITPTQVSQYNKAIAQARQIKANQPMYEQAQGDIERWSRVILDSAEGRAKQGNFKAAIEAAKLVPTDNEPIHELAQRSITQWQKQSKELEVNKTVLQKAQALLKNGEASSYNRAIALARQVPSGQPKYPEAKQLIGTWSQNILDIAKKRATGGNVKNAIATANLVPQGTPAYSAATEAIATWQRQQNKR